MAGPGAKAAAGAQGNSDKVQALPAAPGHSGTNTHEAGVDEPDLVKTDGRRIVTISRGTLRVVDAASRQITGSLVLDQEGFDSNLLLADDQALVLTRGAPQPGVPTVARDSIRPGEPNPSAPTVGSRLLLVGGLGKGERIYAVRFVGPTGYVVTFRQTDPLYVVDLHDAAQPRVTGELKINGYSAYLHPAGDGRLIGVGQDADDNGRRKGMQVSLFNVADPSRPTRLGSTRFRAGTPRPSSTRTRSCTGRRPGYSWCRWWRPVTWFAVPTWAHWHYACPPARSLPSEGSQARAANRSGVRW
ncbi:MAG: Beta propeller domain protein [Dactylosporangium sp.]|jgi:hypothetical protein|nr:Beta propeller domain protein [Dactylosporangium sp.]